MKLIVNLIVNLIAINLKLFELFIYIIKYHNSNLFRKYKVGFRVVDRNTKNKKIWNKLDVYVQKGKRWFILYNLIFSCNWSILFSYIVLIILNIYIKFKFQLLKKSKIFVKKKRINQIVHWYLRCLNNYKK